MELIKHSTENKNIFLNMIEKTLIEKEEILFSIDNKIIHICKSIDNKYYVNLFKTRNIFKKEEIDFSKAESGYISSNPTTAINIFI